MPKHGGNQVMFVEGDRTFIAAMNAAKLFELVNGGYTIGPPRPPDLRPGINGLG
jgi:hypothetical protein